MIANLDFKGFFIGTFFLGMFIMWVIYSLWLMVSHSIGGYPVGACLIDPKKDGGYYEVLEKADYSYIVRPHGKYAIHSKRIPTVIERRNDWRRVDCFDKDFEKRYRKYILETE